MRGPEKTLTLENWQRLKTSIFWCYDGPPPYVDGFTPYRTLNYSAWLVRCGEATLYAQGEARTLRPGDWVVVPPPDYERRFSKDLRLLSVHFRFTWADDLDLFTLARPAVFPGASHPAVERAARRLVRLYEGASLTPHPESANRVLTMPEYLHFQTLAGRFALALTRALDAEGLLPAATGTRPGPQVARILARLRSLRLDQPWDSAGTARGLSMSTGHFNRVFRQEFGQTPRRYFDTRRLEHAKQGILDGKVSLKEVAAGLGFSPAVFCRWFHQAVGASPLLYRRNVGKLRSAPSRS